MSWKYEVLFAYTKAMVEPHPFHSSKFLLPCLWKVKHGNAREPFNLVSCLWSHLRGSVITSDYFAFWGSLLMPLSFLFGFLLRFLAYLWSSRLRFLHCLWILGLKTLRVLQKSIEKQSVTCSFDLLTAHFGNLSISQRKQTLGVPVGTLLYQTEPTFNETQAAPSLLLLHVLFDECEFMHRSSLLPQKPLKAEVSKTAFGKEKQNQL